jgi:hypothetical protein
VQEKKKPDRLLYSCFERKLRERPICILHSCDDFALILEDLAIAGGAFFAAFHSGGQAAGMAFVSPPVTVTGETFVLIKEILYDNERVKERLLAEINKRYRPDRLVYRTPAGNDQHACPYGMAKVIDRERLIRLWTSKHPESSLSPSEMEAMDVRELTQRLLGYDKRAAYMSLMLD